MWTRERILTGFTGLTAIAAVGALIAVLLQAPKFADVERHIHEVKEEVVTLRLPPGVHARVLTVRRRKGVMPGSPEVKAHVRVPTPGGRPAPARRRRPSPRSRVDLSGLAPIVPGHDHYY